MKKKPPRQVRPLKPTKIRGSRLTSTLLWIIFILIIVIAGLAGYMYLQSNGEIAGLNQEVKTSQQEQDSLKTQLEASHNLNDELNKKVGELELTVENQKNILSAQKNFFTVIDIAKAVIIEAGNKVDISKEVGIIDRAQAWVTSEFSDPQVIKDNMKKVQDATISIKEKIKEYDLSHPSEPIQSTPSPTPTPTPTPSPSPVSKNGSGS